MFPRQGLVIANLRSLYTVLLHRENLILESGFQIVFDNLSSSKRLHGVDHSVERLYAKRVNIFVVLHGKELRSKKIYPDQSNFTAFSVFSFCSR